MFTGLVEAVGEVTEVKPTTGGSRLRLSTALATELANGDSLAVNGVCLTVVSADADGVHMDVSPETARITTLGAIRRGAVVNLDRPLRADARLGGHFVQGHVDGVARVVSAGTDGDAFLIELALPQGLSELMVERGSVAVDGVSLTITGLPAPNSIQLSIIEFTRGHTTLGDLRRGDLVHVEADVIAKYVRRMLEATRLTQDA